MKPLGTLVLLEPIKPSEREGLIHLPPQATHPGVYHQFRVIASGPGKYVTRGKGKRKRRVWTAPEVKAGDLCLCNSDIANKAALDDGRIFVEASQIELVWRQAVVTCSTYTCAEPAVCEVFRNDRWHPFCLHHVQNGQSRPLTKS